MSDLMTRFVCHVKGHKERLQCDTLWQGIIITKEVDVKWQLYGRRALLICDFYEGYGESSKRKEGRIETYK